MYWKVLNMEMNLWELAIYLNILNISKDCQRIGGDFNSPQSAVLNITTACLSQKLSVCVSKPK